MHSKRLRWNEKDDRDSKKRERRDSMNRQQIKSICSKNGFECKYTKVPARECGVDLRIPRQSRYRHNNRVDVMINGERYVLGWIWDIEMRSEEQVVGMLARIAKEHPQKEGEA